MEIWLVEMNMPLLSKLTAMDTSGDDYEVLNNFKPPNSFQSFMKLYNRPPLFQLNQTEPKNSVLLIRAEFVLRPELNYFARHERFLIGAKYRAKPVKAVSND